MDQQDKSGPRYVAPPGYEVREDGTVISHSTNWRGYGSRPITWASDGTPYPVVRLICPDGVRRKFKVHQLVCRKFHGERPSPDHEVRHLDGNPMNNHASNLAWGTRSENAIDRIKHGTQYRPDWSDPAVREKLVSGMRRVRREQAGAAQ